MAEFLIELERMEVGIIIGLHAFEQQAPQRVEISVQVLTADVGGGADDYVDYDAIADHIRGWSGQRVATQEDLVLAIHRFVSGLPHVQAARVSSAKPDVYPDAARVGLSYPARPLFA